MNEKKIINFLKKEAFNLNRSLGGKNNIITLKKIKKIIQKLKIKKIKSGSKVFDWKVPKTWSVKDAYIKDHNGKKIIDIKNNFLHVLNYSSKINKTISKKELLNNLYFLKKKPNSIPYVTTYYKKKWGFCLSYNQTKKLKSTKYKVKIDSKFTSSGLDYGEIFIKGKTKKEIIFSTYICHPALGNDNFSGILINTLLAKFVSNLKTNYSYRFIFIPETIGSIFYINKNFNNLKKNLLAGYVLSCLGVGKKFNILTKYNNYLSYKLLNSYFKKNNIKYLKKNWSLRGSDERQFSSPNVDLPFTLITRNKFLEYKEYHTSLDDINLIKDKDLLNVFFKLKNFILSIEKEKIYISNFRGEPFLSKRNLYSSVTSSYKKNYNQDLIVNTIDYCDGNNLINDISKKLNKNLNQVKNVLRLLLKKRIIKLI